jgi:hypothetical protein
MGWLCHQHTTLPIAYQANILILPVLASTFAPGAGLRSILHYWHDHSEYLHEQVLAIYRFIIHEVSLYQMRLRNKKLLELENLRNYNAY